MNNSISKRQEEGKKRLIEQLKIMPIIQVACQKVGISRATYYRWRNEDPEFADVCDTSLKEGYLFVNDMAESQMMGAIKDKNMTAIIFWLKHHHPAYAPRLEIAATSTKDALSTAEVEEMVKLLYSPTTFRKGQQLLTSYVIRGLVNEKLANLISRMFISQMRVEETLTRKVEAELMAEVMLRKEKKK